MEGHPEPPGEVEEGAERGRDGAVLDAGDVLPVEVGAAESSLAQFPRRPQLANSPAETLA